MSCAERTKLGGEGEQEEEGDVGCEREKESYERRRAGGKAEGERRAGMSTRMGVGRETKRGRSPRRKTRVKLKLEWLKQDFMAFSTVPEAPGEVSEL